jgi:hypothetical protein
MTTLLISQDKFIDFMKYGNMDVLKIVIILCFFSKVCMLNWWLMPCNVIYHVMWVTENDCLTSPLSPSGFVRGGV